MSVSGTTAVIYPTRNCCHCFSAITSWAWGEQSVISCASILQSFQGTRKSRWNWLFLLASADRNRPQRDREALVRVFFLFFEVLWKRRTENSSVAAIVKGDNKWSVKRSRRCCFLADFGAWFSFFLLSTLVEMSGEESCWAQEEEEEEKGWRWAKSWQSWRVVRCDAPLLTCSLKLKARSLRLPAVWPDWSPFEKSHKISPNIRPLFVLY